MALNDKSDFENFIRGSDTLWHRLQMFGSGVYRLVVLGGVVGLLTAYFLFWLPTNGVQREIIYKRTAAQILGTNVYLPMPNGKRQLVDAKTAIEATEAAKGWALWIYVSLALGACAGGFVAYRVSRFQMGKGEAVAEDYFLRGQRLIGMEELAAMTEAESKLGFDVGGVGIPDRLLMRNTAFIGSMGTGKSQGIFNFIDAADRASMKAVVYDMTGEFLERYYNPERGDVILNPYDKRSAAWSVFEDLRSEIDFSALSTFFVPEQKGENNPFFTNAARILFEDLLRLVKLEPNMPKTMSEVARIAGTLPSNEIAEILGRYGLSSAVTVKPDSEASKGVCMTLMAQPSMRFFSMFKGQGFSIRQFIESERAGWLFITSHAEQHESIKPFAAAWIETALMAAMSGRPIDYTRVLFVVDELASLPKLHALEKGLTLGRKFGAAWALGFQSTAQLDHLYGKDMRRVLLSNMQTKAIFRTEEDESAKSLSLLLGVQEVDEATGGQSYGVETTKDSSSIQRKRTEINIVMPSEIQSLPDLTAFLKVAGDYPVAKVRIPVIQRAIKAPAYDLKELVFQGQGVALAEPEKALQNLLIDGDGVIHQDVSPENWWEAK